jgi:hypothetical protein
MNAASRNGYRCGREAYSRSLAGEEAEEHLRRAWQAAFPHIQQAGIVLNKEDKGHQGPLLECTLMCKCLNFFYGRGA